MQMINVIENKDLILCYNSFECFRKKGMEYPTLIALDVKDITRDPRIVVVKLNSTMTVGMLRNRMNLITRHLNLSYGRLCFYQKGRLLRHHTRLVDLPQGTITCLKIREDLCPIQELTVFCETCMFCGQQYYMRNNIYLCSQCRGRI